MEYLLYCSTSNMNHLKLDGVTLANIESVKKEADWEVDVLWSRRSLKWIIVVKNYIIYWWSHWRCDYMKFYRFALNAPVVPSLSFEWTLGWGVIKSKIQRLCQLKFRRQSGENMKEDMETNTPIVSVTA